MERGAGGSAAATPARVTSGGMCDRFLTFLANSGLSMKRRKEITEGRPENVGGGYRQLKEEEEEEDEFVVRIERAEFDFSDHGDLGHGGVTTVLEEASTAARDEQQQQKGQADAPDRPVAVGAAVEETKVRKKTVTIKEDRPPATTERKKSLFKKRQGAGAAGDEEQGGRAPRRSGLRPRMPTVLRVPSDIDQKSSIFIEERRRSLGGGKTAPADK